MYKRLSLSAIAATMLLMAACKNNEDVTPRRKFISFKLDDKVVLSEQSHSALYAPGDPADPNPQNHHAEMLITGYSYNKDVINIHITSPTTEITPGVYRNASTGNGFAMQMNLSREVITANDLFGDLTVTVHSMKDSVITGSFNGTLVSMDDGSLKTVKDGYFRMIYRKYP